MRIKRFVSSDVRQAIRQIRNELGPDAVILSNRQIPEGVEISAAIDYDEAWVESKATNAPAIEPIDLGDDVNQDRLEPAIGLEPPVHSQRSATIRGHDSTAEPLARRALQEVTREISSLRGLVESQLSGLAFGDLARRHPLRANAFQRLLGLGITEPVAHGVCERIDAAISDADAAWRRALGLIAHEISVFPEDLIGEGGVYALLGPTGVGKTTTVAKLAARFALRNDASEVALITTDTYRIGAHEQLGAFAQIMGIPMRVVHDPVDLKSALVHYREKKLVLVDTAGISQRDIRFAEQAAMIRAGSPSAKSLLVLPATTQYRGLEESIHAFDDSRLEGCIITKVDEAVSLGPVISAVCKHRLPTAYLTNGQRIPEDISSCRAHLLVTRAVTLAQEARRAEDLWTEQQTAEQGAPVYASH